ncbi:DNRLRE domain-containing protein [Nonomuraea rubra]|uniref:DNRLRE domain-containing protein n=1 Tax=Nonomuraea rubra TaxID=46180 RepID=UPI0033EBA177
MLTTAYIANAQTVALPLPPAQAQSAAERPDRASAGTAARAQGSRVLVSGETTESSLTYANPDGTLTTELTNGIARVRQNGRWVPVDTTLAEQGGVLRPRAAKAEVEFSAGGQDVPLAELTRDGQGSFALTWPSPLPKPRLEGNKAIYENAAGPGADLVVTALSTGFRHDVLLRERPAGPVEFTLPVVTDGLSLGMTKQGGLKLTDKAGKAVASAPKPVMWDSTPPDQEQAQASPRRVGAIETHVETKNGRSVLVLRPDEKFLTDPATRYPVTVDPTTTLGEVAADASVFSAQPTTAAPDGFFIDASSTFTGTTSSPVRQRSFGLIKFDLAPITSQGRVTVSDAKLQMYTRGNAFCVATQGVTVQRITSAWDENVTYDTRPSTTTVDEVTVDEGSCPSGGDWTWPITPIVQAWTTGTPNHGLLAKTKIDWTSGTERYRANFHSSEYDGSDDPSGEGYNAIPPTMAVTYTVAPDEGPARVMYWNQVLTDAYKKVGGAPGPLARAGAMLQGAVYDAVNSVWGLGRPYLTDITAGRQRYGAAPTAIDRAAHTILTEVYPALRPDFDQALADAATLSAPPSEQDRVLGESVGLQAAQAMINARTGDGSADTITYTPGGNPGDWRPTDLSSAATPHWGRVRPFALTAGNQFRPALPGNVTSMSALLTSNLYATQFNEVKQVGRANSPDRTADQTILAHFWANDLDTTYKPPGQLYEHTRTIVQTAGGFDTFETAQLFAYVGLAMADAGIAAWDAKYDTAVDLWRPETAIKFADTDSNSLTAADSTWKPESKLTTGISFSPAFPAYVSGHATFGGAWAGIMKRYFGRDDALRWTATTNDPFTPGVTRAFSTFSAAAQENALSRVYLGVHYRFDGTFGVETGDKVANHVFTNYLR